jgi:uncharacterized protein
MTVNRAIIIGVAWALLLLAGPARASEKFETTVLTPDGIELATTVELPEADGPFPVLLARTPYGRDGGNGFELGPLAGLLGLAIVTQDTRGTGESTGENDVFFSDRGDGLTTIDWVLEQPWCDGRINQFGLSAVAMPAYLNTPGAPEGLVCQFLGVSTADIYADAVYPGGSFRDADVREWLHKQSADHVLDAWIEHPACADYWEDVRAVLLDEPIPAAAYHMGGWYDMYTQSTLDAFNWYREQGTEWAREHQYVMIGPWSHETMGMQATGELRYPANATMPVFSRIIEWMKWCRDGSHELIDALPPVQYYVMGDVDDPDAPGNEWREADDWPPPFETAPLFLSGDDALGWDAPADVSPEGLPMPVDPADPSPTLGGRNLTLDMGPYDQRPAEVRADALVFTSEVLDEPLEVTGKVLARVFVSAPTADADVAVRLTDVYPDGRSMLITAGVQRLGLRDGCEQLAPLTPDEPVEATVDLWSTSYIFNAGHQIRVVVTGTNAPRHAVNPAVVAAGAPITMRLFADAERLSALLLPVPPDSWALPDEVEPSLEPSPEPSPESSPEVVDAGALDVSALDAGTDASDDGGGGCAVTASVRGDARAAALLLLTIVALAVRRRRRGVRIS